MLFRFSAPLALQALVSMASALEDPNPVDVLTAMNAANAYFTGHNEAGDCGWTRGTYFAGP